MTISAQDEFLHPGSQGDSWQENYLFIGVDPDRSLAFAAHVARLPALDACDVKLCVAIGDEVCSYTEYLALTDELSVAGATLECKEPLRTWRVALSGSGRLGSFPGHLVCTLGGDIPTSADIVFSAVVPPLDQSGGFDRLRDAAAGSSGHHYNQGGHWSGTLRIGDLTIAGEGPAIRDHTWGERNVGVMDHCWWTPMVLGDGTHQLAGIDMHTKDGTRTSFSFACDADGQTDYPNLDVEIVEGDITDYRLISILVGTEHRVEATRIRRLPIAYLRGGGSGWVSDDALCLLRDETGRTGFGVIERNRLVSAEEADAVAAGANA